MNQPTAQRSIKAALKGNWNEAIEFNLQILQDSPENTEALNRIGRAYLAIGQTNNAKKSWNKVVRIDRYNPIANHQLQKLKSKTYYSSTENKSAPATSGQTFLDEPGKTKTTQLVRLANPKIIMNLQIGQSLNLTPKKRSVAISTQEGQHLGALPDDLSFQLIKFIRGGNKYNALVRRVEKNSLHVFIKETKRSKRYQNVPSFPSHKLKKIISLEPAAPITHSPINVAPTGEEEDYR